jgi:hypothetical protein
VAHGRFFVVVCVVRSVDDGVVLSVVLVVVVVVADGVTKTGRFGLYSAGGAPYASAGGGAAVLVLVGSYLQTFSLFAEFYVVKCDPDDPTNLIL